MAEQNSTNTGKCAEEYVVKRGDSFYLIAHKLGVPLRDLLAANRDIHPARLMVGDVLCVPREEDDSPQTGGLGGSGTTQTTQATGTTPSTGTTQTTQATGTAPSTGTTQTTQATGAAPSTGTTQTTQVTGMAQATGTTQTTLVTGSIAIIALQPLGGWISESIAHGASWAIDRGGFLVGAVLAGEDGIFKGKPGFAVLFDEADGNVLRR